MEITSNETQEQMTIYKNDIEANIQLFFEDMGTSADSIADLKQSQYSYLLGCVGSALFSNNELKQKEYNNNYINSYYYDMQKLESIYNIYIMLCNKYNKIVSLYDYALLCNIEYHVLQNWKYEKTNSLQYGLYRKIADSREQGLKNRCLDSNNIIGTITIGNSENGWNSNSANIQHITNNIITADALPMLQATNKAQITKND